MCPSNGIGLCLSREEISELTEHTPCTLLGRTQTRRASSRARVSSRHNVGAIAEEAAGYVGQDRRQSLLRRLWQARCVQRRPARLKYLPSVLIHLQLRESLESRPPASTTAVAAVGGWNVHFHVSYSRPILPVDEGAPLFCVFRCYCCEKGCRSIQTNHPGRDLEFSTWSLVGGLAETTH